MGPFRHQISQHRPAALLFGLYGLGLLAAAGFLLAGKTTGYTANGRLGMFR